ncbi:MAG: hypothetical protein FJW14_08715 [Acidimicrobiia bacterium]|nr:hypothetical protein [Acidimicrobiia bacterium]
MAALVPVGAARSSRVSVGEAAGGGAAAAAGGRGSAGLGAAALGGGAGVSAGAGAGVAIVVSSIGASTRGGGSGTCNGGPLGTLAARALAQLELPTPNNPTTKTTAHVDRCSRLGGWRLAYWELLTISGF